MNQKIKGFVRGLGPVYRGLSCVRQQLLGAYMRMAHGQGVSPKKVVFSSFKGASCSDSPLAIAQALHALRPDADVVFQLKKDAPAPDSDSPGGTRFPGLAAGSGHRPGHRG